MRIAMRVFSVDATQVQVPAQLADGTAVKALVAAKRVQLVSEQHSTWTLNLTGAQSSEWTAKVGDMIDVDI